MMASKLPMPTQAPLKTPRDYQDAAFPAVCDWFVNHANNPLVVIPTGGGKSLCIAEFIRRAEEMHAGTRFLILSHVSELLVQNGDAVIGQCPNMIVTFYSDKLKQRDLSGQVVIASIQSIHRKAHQLQSPPPDIILVDEAHLIPHSSDGMYKKFLANMLEINPDVKVIGYTATPFRAKGGMLHKGDGALFGGIAYEINVLELIERGYLSPVTTPTMTARMSTEGVKVQGGDFIQKQLEKAVDKDEITVACVDEIMTNAGEQKKWLVFTAGISHCEHVRDEIRRRGIACEMVTGDTPTDERNRIVAWHKQKTSEPRCLVNVAVFTTGFDNPAIDLIAFMRPTRSPVLYIQMIGRGMRTSQGKDYCVVLDFGGVVETLGPIDQIRLPSTKKGEGDAPSKQCPECDETNHAAARVCIGCGFEFPKPEIKIGKGASDAAVLSTQLTSKPYTVTAMQVYRHKKDGRQDTLRVEYLCGLDKVFKRWLSFDGAGGARSFACFWWRKMAGTTAPKSVDEALLRANEIRKPSVIHAKKVGKYFEVTGEDL